MRMYLSASDEDSASQDSDSSGGMVPQRSLLDMLLLAEWEDRAVRARAGGRPLWGIWSCGRLGLPAPAPALPASGAPADLLPLPVSLFAAMPVGSCLHLHPSASMAIVLYVSVTV